MSGYLSQEITLEKVATKSLLVFPPGMENLFLALYIILLPYISGLIFIFLFIFKLKVNMFQDLLKINETSFMINWLVGYEILSGLIIFIILIKTVTYTPVTKTKKKKIPNNRRY